MPQDELFRTRKAAEMRCSIRTDPLNPHLPWRATLLILDARGDVLESDSRVLPPVWEAEAFAEAVKLSASAFRDLTHVRARLAFQWAIRDWTKAAEALRVDNG